MTIDFDLSDFERFASDLERGADKVLADVAPVVKRGAENVKRTMRAEMARSGYFKGASSSITYDVVNGSGWVEARVGPESGGQVKGDLAALAYFGGSNGGGGTVRDPQAALDDEAPSFFGYIERALGGLI